MSWQLVSFLIIAAGILAGFAWYERSRPPSQVVALVAALAALAIAGRIAFAAFPNVKPTTDIVIFAGFALGGAPGFAVGALAALVSNFWFGQGPWTPWQMAAWGLCGMLGAVLALTGRNPNRFVLAAVCGFAGAAYGALLNFSLMATYGGELSLATFALLESRAIPFEVAHVTTNVILSLVAGPAMLRMLIRFRERFEWSRRSGVEAPTGDDPAGSGPDRDRLAPGMRGGAAAASVALIALAALAPAPAHAAPREAVAWLEGAQNPDGGWGSSPGEDSGSATTDWTMLGLEAAGRNPLDIAKDGKTPVDYLRAQVSSLKSPGALARTVLALSGAGVDPRRFAGHDLVAELTAKRRDNGSFEGWPGSTAFAIIALRGAGAPGAAKPAAAWLRKVQNKDGGWGDTAGSPSTSDGTGAAMMALAGSKAAQRGLGFLRIGQRDNGGFPLGQGYPVNTQSTAWAVQGIIAAGGDPASFEPAGKTPFDYLAANQHPDGHYGYATPGAGTSKLVADQTPVWTTAQVLAAAKEVPFPIAAVPREAKPKAPPPSHSQSSPQGSAGGVPPASVAPEPEPELHGGKPQASKQGAASTEARSGVSQAKVAPGGGSGAAPAAGGEAHSGSASDSREATSGDEPVRTTELQHPDSGSRSASPGVVVAILAGLLAGCLLFGIFWAARRGWSRWRLGH
ncbi:MAG TPA: prenyltransferase/squalene oxidase repeat-containing protein [Solirubrobacterales bacterium]|jgi:energy-coupling factor transport system substrate-specific component